MKNKGELHLQKMCIYIQRCMSLEEFRGRLEPWIIISKNCIAVGIKALRQE